MCGVADPTKTHLRMTYSIYRREFPIPVSKDVYWTFWKETTRYKLPKSALVSCLNESDACLVRLTKGERSAFWKVVGEDGAVSLFGSYATPSTA